MPSDIEEIAQLEGLIEIVFLEFEGEELVPTNEMEENGDPLENVFEFDENDNEVGTEETQPTSR